MVAKRRPEIILLAIVPSIALGLTNGLYGDALAQLHPVWYWVADAAQFVLLPALGMLFLYRLGGYSPSDYGFRAVAPGWGAVVGLILLTTFVYWLAYEPVKAVATVYFPGTVAPPVFDTALPIDQPWRTLMLLYVCASAALVEESVFRSLPWLYFSSTTKSPALPYVAATAVLFSAVHWEQGLPNLIATGTLGLAAGVLYTKIRNVWPFAWAHFFAGAWSYKWWV